MFTFVAEFTQEHLYNLFMDRVKQNNIPWDLIISDFKHEISVEEHETLMRWAAHPENRILLDDLQELWNEIQLKSMDYTPDKAYYWKELNRRLKLSASEGEQCSFRRPLWVRITRHVAVAASLLLLVGLAFSVGKNAGQRQQENQVYTCMTGKSKVSLPDGTMVWLHGHTTLTCKHDFQQKERSVEMSGEAYFEVKPDRKKPFIVHTDGMQVVVHGTKFNVEAKEQADESRVSLVDGSVSMVTPSERVFLNPGELAVYDWKNKRVKVEYADLHYETLWAKDQIAITNKSLGEVCRFLSKWYGVKIRVEEELKSLYRYTFILRTESLEEVMRLMSRIHPMAYYFDEDDVLHISSPKK